jgi:hypothetical protein
MGFMTTPELSITFRSWPKVIFSWPGILAAFGAAGVTSLQPQYASQAGLAFLAVWGLILMVLSFEFTRASTLAFLFAVIALAVGGVLLNQHHPFFPQVKAWLQARDASATTEFYLLFGVLQTFFMVMIAVNSRLNYWVISANELTHKRGFLGNTDRYPTDGLKIHTEIDDVFEYLLARSGTIILTVPGVGRPIVLENVVGIKTIEEQVDSILNARNVRVDRGAVPHFENESPSYT